jgi:tetratricopeptide (TPR) repeat protein
MFTFSKRPFYVLSNKFRRWLASHRPPVERMKEKWIADFSKPERSCFDIKAEISYNAYLEKCPPLKEGSLFLGLRKKNCMAWVETAKRVYVNQVIEAHFRFDSLEGYCATGIMFRRAGQGSYYLALVSSKGYFRLDVVNNNIPTPLIGWTETPGLKERAVKLGIIAKNDHLIFFVDGKWVAETHDASIPGGHLAFALVSYDSFAQEEYVCKSWLNYLSVDSRAKTVEAEYGKWNNSVEISAESRFRLAESFAALDRFDAAYSQILRAWRQREEAARSVMATYTETRTRGELFFAARMASRLERYADAEEYINECLATGVSPAEELNVVAEKAKVLSALHKDAELAAFLPAYIKKYADIPSLYALLGHAHWNLENYNDAATAWNKAYTLDKNNELYVSLKKQAQKKKTGSKEKPTSAVKKTTEKPKAKGADKDQPADPEKKARTKRPKDTRHESIP